MTVEANAWCTVHYTTQNFTEIPEIGHLHKGLGSKTQFWPVFLLSPGPVYIRFDVESGD